jgi:hypothetical protein
MPLLRNDLFLFHQYAGMTGLQDDGNHGTAVFDLEGCCFIPFCHCVIEYDRLVRRKRQGSGKGTVEYWVAVVKPGRVLFEIAGVPEEAAREALRLAMHKLPCKCKIASKADLEGGDNSEE